MDWKACLTAKQAKPIAPDTEMSSSLQKTSINKAFSSDALELREETAAAKVSLLYDAVRELLEAIALQTGFKVYNHVCYTAFLKEILRKPELGEEFDVLRRIRNDINYYGKDITVDETRHIINRLEELRKELTQLMR